MSRWRPVRVPRAVLGPAVPGAALAVLLALVGAGLALLVLRDVPALIGVALALAAAARPRWGAGWVLIALVGVAELTRDPSTVGPDLLLLVVGVHAVAVLVGLVSVVPPTARVELAALRRPLLRAIAVQVPCQVVAGVVLLVRGALPIAAAGVVGAVLLVVLVFALIRQVERA